MSDDRPDIIPTEDLRVTQYRRFPVVPQLGILTAVLFFMFGALVFLPDEPAA